MVLVIVVIPLFATVIIVLHNEFWWYCPLFDNRDNFNKSKQTVMWPKWKLNYKAPLIIVSLYNKAWITISFYVLHTGYSGVSHLGLNSICMNNCNWKGYYLATWRVKGTLVSIRERILLFRGGVIYSFIPPPWWKEILAYRHPWKGICLRVLYSVYLGGHVREKDMILRERQRLFTQCHVQIPMTRRQSG